MQKQVINEETQNRVKYLRVLHDTETAKKEAEIFQLKNVALEQEIYERQKAEKELKKYQGKVTGVPAIIVNGKYKVETGSVKSIDELMQLINYLLKKKD